MPLNWFESRKPEFLAAVPPDAQRLVFRRAQQDWSVATAGGVIWTSEGYPGPGKLLYAALCAALKVARPEVELALDLVTEEDWAWYADD